MNALDEKGKVAIYALCCPDSGLIRYIGKANDPDKRFASHLRDARRRNTPVYCWIRSLPSHPVMKVLEWVDADVWPEAEKRLIIEHRAVGKLLNLADGGDCPTPSKEQRAKAARASVASRESSPERKRLWDLKRKMGAHLKWLDDEKMFSQAVVWRFKLGIYAAGCPEKFGGWANVFSKVDKSRVRHA